MSTATARRGDESGAPAPRREGVAPRMVWTIARSACRVFYRIERVGPVVPGGPVLLVANHPNALLDPPLVVATSGRLARFLAKSTLFTMPVVGWMVRGAGSIPVYRRMDAGVDTSKNQEMFAAVADALAEGDAVCLFPEGTTHSSGRLEPLRTGAARIALSAAQNGVSVAVVPVGLNLDRKAVFRSTATVAYGPALDPGPWAELAATDEPSAVRGLTEAIAVHLRDVMVEAEPKEDADIVARVERLYAEARGLDTGAPARLERRRVIAAGLATLRAREPSRFAQLYEQLLHYERRLARFGLHDDHLLFEVPTATVVRFVLRESLAALALLPIEGAGLLTFCVPYGLVALASTWLPVDLEERATYKLGLSVVVYGAWLVTLAILAGRAWGAWAGAAVALALPVLAVAALLAIEREAEVVELARSYLASRRTSDRTEMRLKRRRAEIADLLDETYRWLQGDGQ